MTAKITCTKSDFLANLTAEFAGAWDALPQRDYAEFQEVIDGLVAQANQHRGVFEGHSAYLDLDFMVYPDDQPIQRCANCDAPAVRISAVEPSHGTDTTAKPRCERHALPIKSATKMVPTIWCDTHQVTGAHVERANCVHPHYTHNYVAVTLTMADYAPGTAVKRMLVEASYLTPNANEIQMINVAVAAELTEQGIATDSNERITWVAEYVHELRATSSHR